MCDGHPQHNHSEQTNTQATTQTKTTEQPKFVVEVEETVPECAEEMATR
jgi:hypothetical protein